MVNRNSRSIASRSWGSGSVARYVISVWARIWMRSGRKLSTKPISAIPGRWMSLTVISRHEARDSVRISSWRSSFWSSNSRATLRLCRGAPRSESLLVAELRFRRCFERRLGVRAAVGSAVGGSVALVHALLLEPAELLFEVVGGEIDRHA